MNLKFVPNVKIPKYFLKEKHSFKLRSTTDVLCLVHLVVFEADNMYLYINLSGVVEKKDRKRSTRPAGVG